jgi:TPR repeat protein
VRVPGHRFTVTLALLVSAVGLTAAQHLPPPPERSVYELLNLGPAPAVACTCVPDPFALPPRRPGWGYSEGPARPFENAPVSEADRRANQEWYAEEDQHMRLVSEQAMAGNPSASLAIATHLGLRRAIFGGDDRSEEDAVRWLTLAAEQGHVDAIRFLAHRYATGRGVKQDYTMAATLFDHAARRNDPISMTAIGFLRAAGRGASQDWTVAVRWWQYAEAHSPIAARFLADAYACGAGVAEDRGRALAGYKKAAGEPSASIQLGHMYVRGCAPPDGKAAVAAFRRAAAQGYPDAQVMLSQLLLEDRDTDANTLEAYRWARFAAARLPDGELRKRAAELAATAARAWPAPVIVAEDRVIDDMLSSAAKPLR